ncbi:MarR family winged helix-turn-helix transcriptional regulator [Amycolatopsis minnesotensis]|uniref:MarR family winged helix-turn-helix transcriptional regulator n=1 Tax=Amycolatopsis minnesotensis TaxID=337894 RepID=A0ABP5BVG8_9PSEU
MTEQHEDAVTDKETRTMPGAGAALFRLVRFWTRRWAPVVASGIRGHDENVQNVYVVEAIASAGDARSEVTVADIAHQIGIDRSVASRMIAVAVAAGYVRRDTSGSDARRANLALTPSGEQFLADSHAFQQRTFESLVAHWPADDRRRFAGYLRRLAKEVIDEPQPSSTSRS